jgi:hypothetical protein
MPKILNKGNLKNSARIAYISFSYEKTGLELCDASSNASARKMRPHHIYIYISMVYLKIMPAAQII